MLTSPVRLKNVLTQKSNIDRDYFGGKMLKPRLMWSGISSSLKKIVLYDDFGNPIILTLPRTDRFGDALRRLSEAVNLVAFLEDRSPESLLVEIRDRWRSLA
jgi:hypothetical protein